MAVCVGVALEFIQEFLRRVCFAAQLVVIQHNGSLGIPIGVIQPHITLALGLFARLME